MEQASINLLSFPWKIKSNLFLKEIQTIADYKNLSYKQKREFELSDELISRIDKEMAQIEATLIEPKFFTKDSEIQTFSISKYFKNLQDGRKTIPLFPFMNKFQTIKTSLMKSQKKNNFLNSVFGIGEVIEICGRPGSGRTQICMQLCLNAISEINEASTIKLNGGSFYIDTEGGFSENRIPDLVINQRKYLISTLKKMKIPQLSIVQVENDFSMNNLLDKIFYVRALEYAQLNEIINILEKFLSTHKNIKILIIDSFPVHFRVLEITQFEKERLANTIVRNLHILAQKCQIAVVLVNILTVKKLKNEFIYESPLFCENLFQNVTSRIWLQNLQEFQDPSIVPFPGLPITEIPSSRIRPIPESNCQDSIIRTSLLKSNLLESCSNTEWIKINEKEGIISIEEKEVLFENNVEDV